LPLRCVAARCLSSRLTARESLAALRDVVLHEFLGVLLEDGVDLIEEIIDLFGNLRRFTRFGCLSIVLM